MAQVGGPENTYKFFRDRGAVRVDLGYSGVSLLDYPNVPPSIGMVVSRDLKMIEPLNATISVEELHDLLEIIVIDGHNARQIAKAEAARRRRGQQ